MKREVLCPICREDRTVSVPRIVSFGRCRCGAKYIVFNHANPLTRPVFEILWLIHSMRKDRVAVHSIFPAGTSHYTWPDIKAIEVLEKA